MSEQNMEVQQAVNSALEQQKKKKKKKRLIIIIVIAIVVLIGIIGASGSSDDSKNTDASADSSISVEKQETTDGQLGDYVCTIKKAEICKNWEGKDSVKITYSFTNNASEAESFDIALTDDVYQDGVGLESTLINGDDDDWGIDVKIKPGTTKDVAKVYVLRDKKTKLDVEISELSLFSDDKLVYSVELD